MYYLLLITFLVSSCGIDTSTNEDEMDNEFSPLVEFVIS